MYGSPPKEQKKRRTTVRPAFYLQRVSWFFVRAKQRAIDASFITNKVARSFAPLFSCLFVHTMHLCLLHWLSMLHPCFCFSNLTKAGSPRSVPFTAIRILRSCRRYFASYIWAGWCFTLYFESPGSPKSKCQRRNIRGSERMLVFE